jgi:hypothetical protein
MGDSDEKVRQFCAVVKNFLNYVLAHAVCPEYTDDVLAARKICDLAEREHFALVIVQSLLPGDFGIAASTLYGGHYAELMKETKSAWSAAPLVPVMSLSEAQRVFKTAIALTGTDMMFQRVSKEDVEIVKTEKRYLEVVGVQQPSSESVTQSAKVLNSRGEPGYIKALGVLVCKAWEGPCLDEEDASDDEDDGDAIVDAPIETFWLEHTTLDMVYIGMKMEVQVQELNIGVKFIDHVSSLYCSFYTFLPNEKMSHWKEPSKFLI